MFHWMVRTALALAIAAQVLVPSRLVASQFCNMWSGPERAGHALREHCSTSDLSMRVGGSPCFASLQRNKINARDFSAMSGLAGADTLAALPDSCNEVFPRPAGYGWAVVYRWEFPGKQADILALHSRRNI